jgi:hypothetical protein
MTPIFNTRHKKGLFVDWRGGKPETLYSAVHWMLRGSQERVYRRFATFDVERPGRDFLFPAYDREHNRGSLRCGMKCCAPGNKIWNCRVQPAYPFG